MTIRSFGCCVFQGRVCSPDTGLNFQLSWEGSYFPPAPQSSLTTSCLSPNILPHLLLLSQKMAFRHSGKRVLQGTGAQSIKVTIKTTSGQEKRRLPNLMSPIPGTSTGKRSHSHQLSSDLHTSTIAHTHLQNKEVSVKKPFKAQLPLKCKALMYLSTFSAIISINSSLGLTKKIIFLTSAAGNRFPLSVNIFSTSCS